VRGREPPPLRRGEPVFGKREPEQILERGASAREALLETSGEGALRRASCRADDGKRVREQGAPLAVRRARAVGAHEGERLAPGEPVPLGREDERLLSRTRDAAERVRERDADRAGIDTRCDARLERARERKPARDPRRAPAAERRDPARPELLLDPERVDDARLVHGRERALGRIRSEQEDARRGS